MLNVIQDMVVQLLRERGLDARVCYTYVAVHPPDGSIVDVECSDASVGAELRKRFSQRADLARTRVQTLPAPDMPEWMRVVSGVADVRRLPAHPSELVNQAICGDAVTPLKAEGEWTLVRLDDGYIGWIRNWHLDPWPGPEREAFLARATHRIHANHAPVLSAPEAGATPVTQLVAGTVVAVAEGSKRGWMRIELADGRSGFVPKASLERNGRGRPTPPRLAQTGMRFIGTPYLWGGNTPNGFDCSGLVQRIFRLNGVLLPRDSDMQARIGAERPVMSPADLLPGNLVFFGKSREAITHVGLILPDGDFLHSYGQVVVNSLDPSSPRYLPRLASIWQMTRDPLRKSTRAKGPSLASEPGNP
jgi:cell wall-associated NlpC family hydrolase